MRSSDIIVPAVETLKSRGLAIDGPHPADTMFHPRARSEFDAAICMYHDQALIPLKTIDFDRGVNITLGLPFVRTSPDHGTALAIAGKGVANPASMIEALCQPPTACRSAAPAETARPPLAEAGPRRPAARCARSSRATACRPARRSASTSCSTST